MMAGTATWRPNRTKVFGLIGAAVCLGSLCGPASAASPAVDPAPSGVEISEAND